MRRIAAIAERIRDCVTSPGTLFSLVRDPDKFNRLIVALDVVDDCALALLDFENSGFGEDSSGEAYLRFFGTLQAIVLQQDGISTLHEVLLETPLVASRHSSWMSLRDFRNRAAGHPLDKKGDKLVGRLRVSVYRSQMTPELVKTMVSYANTSELSFDEFPFREKYQNYRREAGDLIESIEQEWMKRHA